MATNKGKSTNQSTENEDMEDTDTTTHATGQRSDPITVGPDKDGRDLGGAVLAAWRGIFHLFGGQVEEWQVTPDGVIAVGFTTDSAYTPSEIVDGISGRDRRVGLIEAYPILMGQEPPAFTESLDLTKWMQQYFRKPDEDGKSPQYVKNAISDYKKNHGFPPRKGRPKKTFRIENLGALDESVLANVDAAELEKLQATLAAAIASKQGQPVEASAS